MSNEVAERLRDAIAEILSEPDHEQCRTATAKDEANCIAEGMFHRGFRVMDDEALRTERRMVVEQIAKELRGASDLVRRSGKPSDPDYRMGWRDAIDAILDEIGSAR